MDVTLTELQGGRALVRKRRSARVVWGTQELVVSGRVVVGSSESAQIRLDDKRVSRVHAELELDDAGVWVRDLHSSNGTWLGSVKVERVCLTEDAELRFGPVKAQLRFDRQPVNVPLWPSDRLGPLVGASDAMRELFLQLSSAAASESTVLLTGETGTGKELAAQQVHALSPRSAGPFVVVDCGALPQDLLDAELFGHTRGAFTGATHDKSGAFEDAHGGTVFLDEIGELPLALQPRLLRVIESRTVRRLGETQHRKIDVRFVAATHRELATMVSEGTFREDLFFRLSVLPLHLPPLRTRASDVPLLLAALLGGKPGPDAEVLEELSAWRWPGNVRELRTFVERWQALGPQRALALLRGASPAPVAASPSGALPPVDLDVPFKELRERWVSHLERAYFEGLFARDGREVSRAAERSGLDRTYVHRLIRKHGL
ncbi:MAG: sigma 54-interacting transcriptional regulator [Archangium sp.]|nr:sigma 54-interacting transcriptional regulator [Archangium sp.]